MVKTTAYLSLGSNLGNKKKNIERVLHKLANINGISFLKSSALYKTSAVGKKMSYFLNSVLKVSTTLSASSLLKVIKSIESDVGRDGSQPHMTPRVIDIDILFFGNKVINTIKLVVPHPKIKERLFVLVPLLEIAPKKYYPNERKKLSWYASEVKKNYPCQKVRKYEN
ncbi:MAG: 2-amino-4-hydroxy-6-hydroxymethyldihydropteridine diphosphokinase [Endomicrobiales bacterium]|nr:2-amino-4-hydroxy-6-hydroxymethyldihydropteridine diphosphokinase [Endomicrobiales bacterium]